MRRLLHRAPTRVSFAAIIGVFAASSAAAQNATTGAIRGRVIGADGTAVPSAQVSAVNDATGFTRRTLSSEDGTYAALLLPPGRYSLRVQRIGFRPFSRDSLAVRISEVATLDVRLQTAATQLDVTTVTASADDRRVDTRQTGVADYVSEREIQRLPALGHDFTDFIALSGLVSPIPEVSTGGTFAVGGGRTSGVNVQIDGADGNFNFFGESRGGARIPFTFSLESIREFQLITNGYDAEYGNYSSAVVNVVTRGGTNQYRGSALAYLRDDQLTNSSFAFPGDTARRPARFEVQQYALSYSGPIVRDKLHFLVSLDGQRRRDPFEAATSRALGVAQPTIDRFTTDLENMYGLAGAKNEFGAFEKTDDVNVMFGRLDWTANAANRISLRANYADYRSENDGLQFGGSRPRTTGSSFTDKNLSVVGEATTVISPSTFNVLRMQLSDEKRPRISNNFLPAITVLDVEGTNDIFYGSSAITFRNDLSERKLQLIDNITTVRGSHTFKLGTNNLFSRIYNQFWLNGNGSYEFASLADFEAKKPSRFTRNVPLSGAEAPVTTFNMGELAFYLQDEWQVTKKLLATMALRYDLSVFGDDFSSVTAVDTLFANRGEAFRTGEAPIDKNNISPRLSFAYDLRGDRTHVLRAGAGLFYGRVPGVLGSNVGIGDDPVLALDCRATAAPPPNFSAFGARGENIPSACVSGSSALGGTREYAFWSKGFEYPETYKASLGYEWRATRRTSFAADLLWGRTDENFTVIDATLSPTTVATVASEGGRPIYVPLAKYNPRNAAATADRSRFAGINRIYVNDNQGVADEFAATFRIDQRIASGQLRVSYTYNQSKDNNSFVCCTNSEGLTGDVVAGSLNDRGDRNGPNYSNTRFVRPHTFIVSGLTDLPLGFSLSGIFRANSGTFFTPSVSGDMNGDGSTGNDLPFIGRPEDMLFQTPADAATYQRLLDENKCLRDAIGTMAKRNSCPNPWMYQFDMSVKKAFFGRGEGQRQVELVADFFNVLNGLNSKWGQLKRVGQTRILSAQSFDAATGKVRYTANAAFGDESFIGPVRQFQTQLGVRVAF